MLFKKKEDKTSKPAGHGNAAASPAAAGGPGIQLTVEGMSCNHCVMRTDKALRAVAGVDKVQVDLGSKTAFVQGKSLDQTALKQAVEEAGYTVSAVELKN